MIKLADIIKPGGSYEIHLINGQVLMLVGPRAQVSLDHADDERQLLHLAAVVTSGRNKGSKSKTIIPYGAILKVIVG